MLTVFPSIKKKKLDERHITNSFLNTAHSAVAEGSPPTCHFTPFLRGLRSRRNSGETEQLDHTQGLSQSSDVNNRGELPWQSPLSKLPNLPSAK